MGISLIVFDEPDLEFRYGQRTKDPRDGLAVFGPFDTDQPSHPAALPYILLGTDEGISKFRLWSTLSSYPATFAPKGHLRLWPPFPGFEVAFSAIWPAESVFTTTIARNELLESSRLRDPHERAHAVVQYFLDGLSTVIKRDEKLSVAVCVIPDEVWTNCRPKSRVINPTGDPVSPAELSARKAGQLSFISQYDPEQYLFSPDFRRQLKARAMAFDFPIQIIRESTLRPTDENEFGKRGLTPLSDRMWNIGTALYYKGGGKPWRLDTARPGVCYIGIAFRRTGDGETACCAAQMFLDSGDGIVFLGEFGPWYSPRDRQFHLSREAAADLLRGTLETYATLDGKPLTEVFLHSRSIISDDEFAGYQLACPVGVKLVGIRIRSDFNGPRLYRLGRMPVMRGSFWRTSEVSGLLWGSGFKTRAATYDGPEVPVPMRIDIQHGDAAIERVAQDVFSLTKLNYNACRLGNSEPVTIGFSDAVGEILVSNPTIVQRKSQLRYYI